MKRLLVLLVSGLALFAIPVATADGPDPAVTVQATGVTYVYDYTAQVYRLVPDFATGVHVGLNWSGVDWTGASVVPTVDELAAPVGADLPSVWDPMQFAELANGSLYSLGDDGAYHYIPDPSTAFALGMAWTGTDWFGVTHLSSVDQLPGPVGDALTAA